MAECLSIETISSYVPFDGTMRWTPEQKTVRKIRERV